MKNQWLNNEVLLFWSTKQMIKDIQWDSPCLNWILLFQEKFLRRYLSRDACPLSLRRRNRESKLENVSHFMPNVAKLNSGNQSQDDTLSLTLQPEGEGLFLSPFKLKRNLVWKQKCTFVSVCQWNKFASLSGHYGDARDTNCRFKDFEESRWE